MCRDSAAEDPKYFIVVQGNVDVLFVVARKAQVIEEIGYFF